MAAPLAGVLATLIVSVPVGTGVGALVAEGVGRLQVRLWRARFAPPPKTNAGGGYEYP